MPATVTVLYPAASDATFNMDYYMASHMPLVMNSWKKYGLQGWKVTKFAATATGDASPYTVQALLHFDSVGSFQSAAQSTEAGAVMGDIPKFSNKEPVIMVGEVVGTDGSQA